MLTSLALMFLVGIGLGSLINKLRLPSLIGMIFTGIILGPFALNLLDDKILTIAPELRKFALVIILTRAGLSLNISDLKKVGRPAILMCFVPALFEILGVMFIAPKLFGITLIEAGILGTVIAAVSPAVIVPRMIKIKEEGYGENKSIPQLILAGASVDDVFVIVLFTAFLGLESGESISLFSFLAIPISIIVGIGVGCVCGYLLVKYFKAVHIRDSLKVIIILSISFLLLEAEDRLVDIIPFSSLLSIMTLGIVINRYYPVLAKRIQEKYNRLWVAAEIILFVLVGATVDIKYAISAGVLAIILVIVALVMRVTGVAVSLVKTNLTKKERIFCMGAYTPKATVQAGIGGIPLAMGMDCGVLVLTVAVLSILITAPLGAFFVDNSYTKLLSKDR